MGQVQGNSNADGGRIDGSIGTAVVAADFALGAGWGTTASASVLAGSNDQRGIVTVTSNGTGQAQATATLTLTFHDGAYAKQPFGYFRLVDSSNAITEAQPLGQTVSTTALVAVHSVLPVATKTYKFAYIVAA